MKCSECGSKMVETEPAEHECDCEWCAYAEFNPVGYRCSKEADHRGVTLEDIGLDIVEYKTEFGTIQILKEKKR